MADAFSARFEFIRHALEGTGGFAPAVIGGTHVGASYLDRYPRESDIRFARRNEVAWYASVLADACARFVGYLSMRPPTRDLGDSRYALMADDADGRGNALDVFWQQFAFQAKARGTMLLLVDMRTAAEGTRADQLAARAVPTFHAIAPEKITAYQLGDDGKFDFAEFGGVHKEDGGTPVPVTWRFDRAAWSARDAKNNVLAGGAHPLEECPLLIFTESGDFPCIGNFAPIADLSQRLFNLHSEHDEILRSQTFSLLTMQVPESATDESRIAIARTVGETIGTNNMMVHSGATPAFIAPPEGPARIYLETIAMMRQRIDEIGLNVQMPDQQESGIALQMRFHALNAALATFAARMEDLERRAWELARRWLANETAAPAIQWRRDFALADVATELTVLQQLQAANAPAMMIAEQFKRIASIQFGGMDQARQDELFSAIDEPAMEHRAQE